MKITDIVRAQPLLGTFVEIKLISPPVDLGLGRAHQVIDQAFRQIKQIQQLMSFYDPDSQLSILNREAFQTSIRVHSLVYALLLRAQKVFLASQGLFDCTVADRLVDWSLLPQQIISPESATQADVLLLPNRMVHYNKPLLLDLGGIAKGFAVDLAIHALRQAGIQNAVVNAGGDLRVMGKINEPISIRSPQDPQHMLSVGELSAGALATSAIYYSRREFKGKTVSALVNPYDREAVTSPHSFSVVAPTAWLADALTKVVAVSADTAHPCLDLFGASAFII